MARTKQTVRDKWAEKKRKPSEGSVPMLPQSPKSPPACCSQKVLL
jgi:hypothetical protein